MKVALNGIFGSHPLYGVVVIILWVREQAACCFFVGVPASILWQWLQTFYLCYYRRRNTPTHCVRQRGQFLLSINTVLVVFCCQILLSLSMFLFLGQGHLRDKVLVSVSGRCTRKFSCSCCNLSAFFGQGDPFGTPGTAFFRGLCFPRDCLYLLDY